jgi:hypothetical protein
MFELSSLKNSIKNNNLERGLPCQMRVHLQLDRHTKTLYIHAFEPRIVGMSWFREVRLHFSSNDGLILIMLYFQSKL